MGPSSTSSEAVPSILWATTSGDTILRTTRGRVSHRCPQRERQNTWPRITTDKSTSWAEGPQVLLLEEEIWPPWRSTTLQPINGPLAPRCPLPLPTAILSCCTARSTFSADSQQSGLRAQTPTFTTSPPTSGLLEHRLQQAWLILQQQYAVRKSTLLVEARPVSSFRIPITPTTPLQT